MTHGDRNFRPETSSRALCFLAKFETADGRGVHYDDDLEVLASWAVGIPRVHKTVLTIRESLTILFWDEHLSSHFLGSGSQPHEHTGSALLKTFPRERRRP